MTREKKELLKKIEEMETWIAADTELGCGFAPPSAYDKTYGEIYALQKKLAHLRHYNTVEDMLYDERGQLPVDEILRQAELSRTRKQKQPRNHPKDKDR